MSITKDFEGQMIPRVVCGDGYTRHDVDELLAHTRALEAMLKDVRDDVVECLNYEMELEKLRPDRAEATRERLEKMDKLLEGVE